MGEEENPATALFREYLRIQSVQPNPDYDGCLKLLKREADSLGLPYKVIECVAGKPLLVMTWEGTDPTLPAVLLNSHTDVVPVFPDKWKHEPFSAHKEENGDIYARGSQDMKCVGIQHLEAVRRLKGAGQRFKRTIHLSFVADEELGGNDGMKKFVDTQFFKEMNVGFGLDEGIAVPGEVVPIFYGERSVLWTKMVINGSPGHGSRFLENTVGVKANVLLDKLMKFREDQRQILVKDPSLTLGDVTTVNLTMMEGGVQPNVVPDKFIMTFDCRVSPSIGAVKFEQMLRSWADESGADIQMEFIQFSNNEAFTSVDPNDPWYNAMLGALKKHNMQTRPEIFPAGTDSRFLRNIGIPCLGFSPMDKTPTLLHDHNEFLNEAVFLRGIDIFTDIVQAVASV